MASLWGIVPLFEALNGLRSRHRRTATCAQLNRFARGAERYLNPTLEPVPGFGPEARPARAREDDLVRRQRLVGPGLPGRLSGHRESEVSLRRRDRPAVHQRLGLGHDPRAAGWDLVEHQPQLLRGRVARRGDAALGQALRAHPRAALPRRRAQVHRLGRRLADRPSHRALRAAAQAQHLWHHLGSAARGTTASDRRGGGRSARAERQPGRGGEARGGGTGGTRSWRGAVRVQQLPALRALADAVRERPDDPRSPDHLR